MKELSDKEVLEKAETIQSEIHTFIDLMFTERKKRTTTHADMMNVALMHRLAKLELKVEALVNQEKKEND